LRRGLAFLADTRPLDSPGALNYGMRLSRLRWQRAARPDVVVDWTPRDAAAGALAAAETWVFVPDASALPHASGGGGACHTLRELEQAARGRSADDPVAAVVFRPGLLPPGEKETIKSYVSRLLETRPPVFAVLPSFTVGDPTGSERAEVLDRLPPGPARVLDVGCGSGGLGGERARREGWKLTGIEMDPFRAARARERGGYERILEGDLQRVLPALAAEGARFDAIVFADVLEHLDEPAAALTAARRVAAPGARLLVVVPNVGHLSLVRDLLLGRHDPVPAGLCDAGHLRWFTKASLGEAIEEAGWEHVAIESAPGAPAPDAGPFLELAARWPDADRESLATYQWIATARALRVA
jgi:SAM-dependent methyltransferase